MELILSLLFLAIVGGIAFGIYALMKRRRGEPESQPDVGIGTPRRFYFYSISFIAAMILASGVMIVLMSLLDTLFGDLVLRDSTTTLASGLAMTIVGLPLWFFHWRFVQSAVVSTPTERRSTLRKLHLYATAAVALGFMAVGGYQAIEFVLGGRDFSAFEWSAITVWAVVWYFHWQIASSETPSDTSETRAVRRLYLYVASAVSVAMLASGIGWLVYIVLREGYLAAFEVSFSDLALTGLASDAFRTALAVAITGGAIWASHWLRFALSDRASTLRWIYLFLAAVGFGAIPALTGLGIILNAAFAWLFGASADSAADHFLDTPAAIATLAAGVGLWTYFRQRMRSEAAGGEAIPVARAYDCLLTAIGLLVLAAASVTIFNMAFTLISDTAAVIVGDRAPLWSSVAFALTLLLIGAPAWWLHWRRLQAAATGDPAAERTALPRKLYVLGVLCLSVLALVGGASSALFVFLRDLLDASLSADTLGDLSIGIAVVLTTALIAPYHWTIYRQDRQYEPDEPDQPTAVVRKSVTLLIAPGGDHLATAIEAALGHPITAAHWPDPDAIAPTLDDERLASLPAQVSAAPGASVILVPQADGLRVISYE